MLFHSEAAAGLHAMRFFKDGVWTTVVVDDLIPCHGKLKPNFSTNSEPRDGPVALLQKGLAKLYRCYEHLDSGRVGSALEVSERAWEGEAARSHIPRSSTHASLRTPFSVGHDGRDFREDLPARRLHFRARRRQAAWRQRGGRAELGRDVRTPRFTRQGAHTCHGWSTRCSLSIAHYSARTAHHTPHPPHPLHTSAQGGHLLGASFKPKYADKGGQPAMPAELDGNGALVYPILELRESQNQQFVRLRNPWRLYKDSLKAPEWKGKWGPMSSEWQARRDSMRMDRSCSRLHHPIPEHVRAHASARAPPAEPARARDGARWQAARRILLDDFRRLHQRLQQSQRVPPLRQGL